MLSHDNMDGGTTIKLLIIFIIKVTILHTTMTWVDVSHNSLNNKQYGLHILFIYLDDDVGDE